MRTVTGALGALLLAASLQAQAPGRFPPESLVNTHVIPRSTPVTQVIGQMRNIVAALGVRCQYCHIGEEGQPLAQFDFASDDKRTKRVARHMMRMVQDINGTLDSMPGRETPNVAVSCNTCHRGVSRPVPLSTLIADAATVAGTDSALRAYRALRERYYGSDAYDFREPTLNIAAFRLGSAGKFAEAFALLNLNEELYPNSSGMSVFRGNINLMRGDTAAAEAAYREAVRRDPRNEEARGRLRDIGRPPQ
jgi:hypothetical protein